MIIGTLNIRNLYKLKRYNGVNYNGVDNTNILKSLLEQNDIDVLGVQELVRYYENNLRSKLQPEYSILGNYRFKSNIIVNNLEILNRFNESTAIITNQNVVYCDTMKLPWLGSTLPRIFTFALIDNEELGEFVFINTHLDFFSRNVQIKQLRKLKEIISKIKYPIILSGDFNLELGDSEFENFVNFLESIGIKRININETTYKNSECNGIIDHIFISDKFSCENFKVIETSDEFSDHNLLVAEIKKVIDKSKLVITNI